MADDGPRSILLIRMSHAGDVLLTLPVLRAVRAAFPQAHIAWAVDDRFQDLVRCDPQLDEVHVIPTARWRKLLRSPSQWGQLWHEYRQVRQKLRARDYDVCLDLHGIIKAGLVGRMARCKRHLHMRSARLWRARWLFPGEWIAENGPHLVDRTLPLAAAIGADISNPRFDFFVPPEAQAAADALLTSHEFGTDGPLVALNPGATGPARKWPVPHLIATAQRLRQQVGARIVVLGGPTEVELSRSVVDGAQVGALSTAGKTTFLELAGLLKRCAALVSGDTGPMHLAVAVGTPVVALFGPSNPAKTGPYGNDHIVIHRQFPCGPCFEHVTCKNYDCMRAIEPEEVTRAVLDILARRT